MGFLLSSLYQFFLTLLMGSTLANRKYCHIILCELLRKKILEILKGSAVRVSTVKKGVSQAIPHGKRINTAD